MTHLTSRHTYLPFAALLTAISVLSACGGGGGSIADSATDARVAPVTGGDVAVRLSQKSVGTVSDANVGLVAYATGVDSERGQIVAAAGIEGTPDVGAEVRSGVVTYNSTFNYGLVKDVSRTSTTITGSASTLRTEGRAALTADFGAGTLTGNGGAWPLIFGSRPTTLTVDGKINGHAVTGTATIDYPDPAFSGSSARGSLDAELNGQIGDNGVIATFTGHNDDTTIAGGIVGTAN